VGCFTLERACTSPLVHSNCDAARVELSAIGDCRALTADISTAAGCSALAADLAERESHLHVLVNSAGTRAKAIPLEEYPDSEWDELYATHVKAPFTLTRGLLRELEASASDTDPARVINIGSVAGTMVMQPPLFTYQSCKAALHHLTRRLAKELAPKRITVNAIVPGVVLTPWFSGKEDVVEKLGEANPLGRNGSADDLAGAAVYLASPAGAYLTGVLLPVAGGMSTPMRPNTVQSDPDDVRAGWPRGLGPVPVVGAFDVPFDVLAFDEPRVAAMPRAGLSRRQSSTMA